MENLHISVWKTYLGAFTALLFAAGIYGNVTVAQEKKDTLKELKDMLNECPPVF